MRLSKPEIRRHRATLEAWQRPSQMLKRARALMDLIGDVDLFNQAGVDFLLEAWAAAKFARARGTLRVRLVSAREQFPDFEVRTRARAIEQWEFTEIDPRRPERPRGDEYRQRALRRIAGNHAVEGISIEEMRRQVDRIPSSLRDGCRAKVEKEYGGRVGLLVYLNFSDFGFWYEEIEQSLLSATKVAKDSFTEVWVLWGARLYRKWHDGAAAELVCPVPWRSSEL